MDNLMKALKVRGLTGSVTLGTNEKIDFNASKENNGNNDDHFSLYLTISEIDDAKKAKLMQVTDLLRELTDKVGE